MKVKDYLIQAKEGQIDLEDFISKTLEKSAKIQK